MKIVKHLANLGYGSRKEVERMIKKGALTDLEGNLLSVQSIIQHHDMLWLEEPLDPVFPLLILFHKPLGYTCSHDDAGKTIYDLLPPRFIKRNPKISSIGRLDKETSGLLLLTDDGQLSHQLTHPKKKCTKTYQVILDQPLQGNEASIFASGAMLLKNDPKPLLPADLEILSEREVLITIQEGRYHQVRQMFAAVNNHVLELKRIAFGAIKLNEQELPEGSWKLIDPSIIHHL